jgi:chromosome segregation ATPase
MATVSIIIALLALAVAVGTLAWCQRLHDSVARLRTIVAQADTQERLNALTSEFQSLHTRVEHLRQGWQADMGKLEAVVRQGEKRLVEFQQGHDRLNMMSSDLEGLQDFRRQVEPVLRQWENRIAELEQSYARLSAVSQDLDNLRDFRRQVEKIHAGIQKAINGTFGAAPSPLVPTEGPPHPAD